MNKPIQLYDVYESKQATYLVEYLHSITNNLYKIFKNNEINF